MRDDKKFTSFGLSFSWANMILFCAVLVAVGVLALVLPKPTFSEVEKRELAAKPRLTAQSLFSAEFMRDFSAYYADTFPGREGFITLAHAVENLRGVRPDDVKVYEGKPAPQPDPAPQPAQEPQSSSAAQSEESSAAEQPPQQQEEASRQEGGQPYVPADDEDAVGYLMNNGIFIFKNRAVNLFGGSDAMGSYYAQTINSYLDEIDPSVQVYDLVAPCSAEFYLPARYRASSGDQYANIQHIYSEMDSRVKTVDAYGALAGHTDEYIYFRTDHHWTALGAYYAYTAFCQQAGFDPVPLEEMEARTREGFLGTFYTQTGDPVLQQDPDSLTYYIPDTRYESWMRLKDRPYDLVRMQSIFGESASMTNSYSIFLYGDYPLEKIVTEHKNGRRIAVVKESYGNAFVPFLLAHYEEILVVDQRYFQTSLLELMQQEGVTDLLFLNNAFAANTPYHIERIGALKHQVWTPPEAEEEEEAQGGRVIVIEEEKKSRREED